MINANHPKNEHEYTSVRLTVNDLDKSHVYRDGTRELCILGLLDPLKSLEERLEEEEAVPAASTKFGMAPNVITQ